MSKKKQEKKNYRMLKRLISPSLLSKMSRDLGLEEWYISVEFTDEMEDYVAGECDPWPEYRKAFIRLSTSGIRTKVYALEVLHHEMLHCVVSPMRLHQSLVLGVLKGKALRVAHESFRAREEELISNIETVMRRSGSFELDRYLEKKDEAKG